jgi:hypothetical protein
MMKTTGMLLLGLSLSAAAAQDNLPVPAAAYRAVMRAQYGARKPPPPMSAGEAQHIYDAYLSAIGRSGNHRSSYSGIEEPMPQGRPGQ